MNRSLNIFTICSYSNLNQAVVLYNSILKNSSINFTFYCYLIDDFKGTKSINLESFVLINSTELSTQIVEFNEMKTRYNPFELCCALKPYCAAHLIAKSQPDALTVYLDSDIYFYSDPIAIINEIGTNSILLTPHFISPPTDFIKISELDINNSGLYNGGFFAVSNSVETDQFLSWWMIRMINYCKVDFINGQFVDQIWLNFVPLYFNKVKILKHLGFNFAYWNFHERLLSKNSDSLFTINATQPLVFFHFSGYRLYRKDLISIHQDKFKFDDLPEIRQLFNDYANELEHNSIKLNLPNHEGSNSTKLKGKLKSYFQKKNNY